MPITFSSTTGQTLYVRVQTGASTFIAAALTEGSSGGLGLYVVSDAALVSAGLNSASTGNGFEYRVFSGSPSTTAGDTLKGYGRIVWSGSVELLPPASLSAAERTAIQDADPRMVLTDTLTGSSTGTTLFTTNTMTNIGGFAIGDIIAIYDVSAATSIWRVITDIDTGTNGIAVNLAIGFTVQNGVDYFRIYEAAALAGSIPQYVWAYSSRTVTLADGVTHGGTTAKLRLGSTSSTPALYITNTGGVGFRITASGGNGAGMLIEGNGTAPGFEAIGGATGAGGLFWGGATSGDGLQAIAGGGGHGLVATAVGSSKHGALVTGGTGGTSDGLKLVAGTGGVGFRTATITVTTNSIAWNTAWDTSVQADCTASLAAEAGSGVDQVTIPIQKDGTDPVVDAQVWITSDSAGHSVVAGPLRTNSEGEVTFLLTDGNTYYLWMKADGVDSINGEQFVAEAD